MADILLIHGAWHGAWCWYKVVPRLEHLGHNVLAIDLPGHGRNQIGRPPTLDDYTDAAVQALNTFNGPAFVVGHSMGGVVLQRACEVAPERVRAGIYLTALCCADGESMVSEIAHETSGVQQHFLPSEDGQWVTVSPDGQRASFFGDCSEEDVALARLCLSPQATHLTATPVRVSAERFGSVPRT